MAVAAVQLRPRLFTVAEYYQMGAAGIFGHEERVELIEGQIVEVDAILGPPAAIDS